MAERPERKSQGDPLVQARRAVRDLYKYTHDYQVHDWHAGDRTWDTYKAALREIYQCIVEAQRQQRVGPQEVE